MEIAVQLQGNPTENHCSKTSTICPCNYLNIRNEKCKLFNKNLSYDWEAHAYARCSICIDNELSEVEGGD